MSSSSSSFVICSTVIAVARAQDTERQMHISISFTFIFRLMGLLFVDELLKSLTLWARHTVHVLHKTSKTKAIKWLIQLNEEELRVLSNRRECDTVVFIWIPQKVDIYPLKGAQRTMARVDAIHAPFKQMKVYFQFCSFAMRRLFVRPKKATAQQI